MKKQILNSLLSGLIIHATIWVNPLFCMDAPLVRFNYLVQCHNFNEARKCAHEDTVCRHFRCPLYETIRDNDHRAVSFLLSLPIPCYQDHYDVVSDKKVAKLLINQEVTQENKNRRYIELLKRVVNAPNTYESSFVHYLIRNIPDINMRIDERKNTFLYCAIKNNAMNVVQALLDHPAINPYKSNISADTPFECALMGGDRKIISLFNKKGMFFWPAESGNPFKLVIYTNAEHFSKSYSKKEFLVAQLIFNAKQKAEQQSHHIDGKKISDLRTGIICNSKGYFFMNAGLQDLEICAGKKKFERAQQHLLHQCLHVLGVMKKEDAHYFKGSVCEGPFLLARPIDCNRATKKIIKYPYALFYDQSIAFQILFSALKAPNVEAFAHIIKNLNPDLSLVDEHGNTLLHHVALLDKQYEARLLIENGIDCFIRNKKGETAFDIARVQQKEDCLKGMISHFSETCSGSSEYARANIKQYVKEGYYLSQLRLVYVYTIPLLHHGMLHNIAGNPYEWSLILLQAGAYADVKDSQGKTVLERVIQKVKKEDLKLSSFYAHTWSLIPLLLEHGAQVTQEMVNDVVEDKDTHAILLNAWNKQEQKRKLEEKELLTCCICFEVDSKIFPIPCENKHSDRVCQDCSALITACPVCRKLLQK